MEGEGIACVRASVSISKCVDHLASSKVTMIHDNGRAGEQASEGECHEMKMARASGGGSSSVGNKRAMARKEGEMEMGQAEITKQT
jgi:hypothetical protein